MQAYPIKIFVATKNEEAKKLFSSSPSSKHNPEAVGAEMQLALSDVTLPSFLATKFCVYLDLRTTDDKQLHGNCRRHREWS